jgi:hypothetical protein
MDSGEAERLQERVKSFWRRQPTAADASPEERLSQEIRAVIDEFLLVEEDVEPVFQYWKDYYSLC